MSYRWTDFAIDPRWRILEALERAQEMARDSRTPPIVSPPLVPLRKTAPPVPPVLPVKPKRAQFPSTGIDGLYIKQPDGGGYNAVRWGQDRPKSANSAPTTSTPPTSPAPPPSTVVGPPPSPEYENKRSLMPYYDTDIYKETPKRDFNREQRRGLTGMGIAAALALLLGGGKEGAASAARGYGQGFEQGTEGNFDDRMRQWQIKKEAAEVERQNKVVEAYNQDTLREGRNRDKEQQHNREMDRYHQSKVKSPTEQQRILNSYLDVAWTNHGAGVKTLKEFNKGKPTSPFEKGDRMSQLNQIIGLARVNIAQLRETAPEGEYDPVTRQIRPPTEVQLMKWRLDVEKAWKAQERLIDAANRQLQNLGVVDAYYSPSTSIVG